MVGMTDGCGCAVTRTLGARKNADIFEAPTLLDTCSAPKRLLADKGYDSNSLHDPRPTPPSISPQLSPTRLLPSGALE